MFEVKIIEDSIYEGSRLTTFQLKYPRFIHAEFMTHRVFSRNASSSRAIPVEKMIEQVRTNPAMPIHWGKNQAGMQAEQELTGKDLSETKYTWDKAARCAARLAEQMVIFGVHKQVANRILEPFQWISVVCTATEYDNFFALRCHADAQPEIKHLAEMMKKAYDEHRPTELALTQYHLPYVSENERTHYSWEECVKFSVARCARVSYLTHDGENPSAEKDIALYDRLVGSKPLHASPAEHQAKPMNTKTSKYWYQNGNFDYRWKQYRKYLEINDTEEFFK